MRPVIALVADVIADDSVHTSPNTVDISPTMFKDTILEAGGLPITIPYPTNARLIPEVIQAYLPLFDGLILPGGPDVDPTRYGEQPRPQLQAANPLLDAFELALIKATYAAGKPMFGLCRGSHILNVAFGGTLYQDLETEKTDALRHLQATSGEYPTHHVAIVPQTRLAKLLGDTAYVNSRHHQASRTLGKGLRLAAKAYDGTIEAFESEENDLILGIQWHPENLWQDAPAQLAIYSDFIDRAEAHRQSAMTLAAGTTR